MNERSSATERSHELFADSERNLTKKDVENIAREYLKELIKIKKENQKEIKRELDEEFFLSTSILESLGYKIKIIEEKIFLKDIEDEEYTQIDEELLSTILDKWKKVIEEEIEKLKEEYGEDVNMVEFALHKRGMEHFAGQEKNQNREHIRKFLKDQFKRILKVVDDEDLKSGNINVIKGLTTPQILDKKLLENLGYDVIVIDDEKKEKIIVIDTEDEGGRPYLITKDELDQTLIRLRKDIYEEIKKQEEKTVVGGQKTIMVNKDLYAGKVFTTLPEGKIIKYRLHENDQKNLKAMESLEELLKHKPHKNLLLNLKTFNDRVEIKQASNIIDLHTLICTGEKLPSLKKILEYVKGAMDGYQYLLDNDFLLQDTYLQNIAIDYDDDEGKLFDFDGLFLKEDGQNNYTGRPEDGLYPPNIPPELFDPEAEYDKKTAVYQFGAAISRLNLIYGLYMKEKENSSPEEIEETSKVSTKLLKLYEDMCLVNENKRPSLKQATQKLKEIIN